MYDHDPYCPNYPSNHLLNVLCGYCDLIERVRSDERERIAVAIEMDPIPDDYEVAYKDGFVRGSDSAANIARNSHVETL